MIAPIVFIAAGVIALALRAGRRARQERRRAGFRRMARKGIRRRRTQYLF